jgi:Fe2+ or Zn2+ uptake regulation protein
MTQVNFNKVIQTLSLKTRREILRTIADRPKTLMEIYDELREKKTAPIKYRESVYKALEKLVSVGLVEKIYEKRTVRYKSKFSKIVADLINEKLRLV